MSGSKNLTHLLASMSPALHSKVFAFVTLENPSNIPEIEAVMQFQEKEGLTLIAPKELVEKAGLDYEFPCRMITLNIHSSLDAVGFLAAITTHLATLGVGVNPVSGFYHDHLFIPEERADDVMKALEDISEQHRKFE